MPCLQPLSAGADALQSVRLIATDMDGTLTQQGQFTAALLHALTDLAEVGITVLIVTGRSAGWVQGLVSYLPIAGAIAENGGLFYPGLQLGQSGVQTRKLLVPITDFDPHRRQLAAMFQALRKEFPTLCESEDNRFRLTDWTFDVQGFTPDDLERMRDRCQAQGWDFTYSTVQCHIKLPDQEKAIGLAQVLEQYFPPFDAATVVTVGDSPNDESLFDRASFPLSVGVANLLHYTDRLTHLPTFVTRSAEVEGFCELADRVISGRKTGA